MGRHKTQAPRLHEAGYRSQQEASQTHPAEIARNHPPGTNAPARALGRQERPGQQKPRRHREVGEQSMIEGCPVHGTHAKKDE